ncbi:Holliday junction ATP-dependent DNA helicase RuvA [Actinomyces bovis]|uniref:Holliday junction branch migration complex subunit RuvA n=1 Tax=Actinomyces bovis TaxID=1658 RepID=A0ABY1VPP0_9ACTO|nr:Holliday junction branch migration protein RuvA [Actinomyces bovis]SPT54089.1 Holliday junction ATP-dependent DNA helicase RuvA [Actinomyces bovis]VEG53698.1 Holliday junction ATP-dependent DNA helicase RuvA [Actinomyces israelii]
MISSLRGQVIDLSLTAAVIETGGAGLRVLATPTTLASLRVGQETLLYTELIVREDSMTLYGFADADERDCFQVLLGAKGVGAKLALAMLAVHTPDALRRAIASQDVAALKRVPGLGPKGAQRVIIDVGDKLGPVQGGGLPVSSAAEPTSSPVSASNPDVVAALVQLGWNEAAATQAVAAVEAGLGGENMSIPELLRAALRWLGGGHRA